MSLRRLGAPRITLLAAIALLALSSPRASATTTTTPLQITTSSLPSATIGSSYDTQLSASGGTPPYSWSVASGALPGGFLLSSTGELEGLPTSASAPTINFRVSDSAGLSATRSITLTINAPPPPPEALVAVNGAGALTTLGLTAPLPPPSAGTVVTAAIVGVAFDPSGLGLWLASADGRVLGVGVPSEGSVGRRQLSGHIIAIAALPGALGYYLLSSTGRVYGFGAARARGSYGGRHPVAIAVAPNDRGYYVAGADGSVQAFGGATDDGGVSPRHRSGRIIGIATLRSGGYVVVSNSGRVWRFGAARSVALLSPRPVGAVAVAAAPTGAGYFVVTAAGSLFTAGTARNLGALGPAQPVTALAAAP